MQNQIGHHKGSDRRVVRSLVATHGLGTTLNLFYSLLSSKVAGTKGRSTLEERPYHFARRGIQAALRSLPRASRGVELTSPEELQIAQTLLNAYGPAGIVNFLCQITTGETKVFQRNLTRAANDIAHSLEHLAVRRALFPIPSKRARELGLGSFPPPAAETDVIQEEASMVPNMSEPPPAGDSPIVAGV